MNDWVGKLSSVLSSMQESRDKQFDDVCRQVDELVVEHRELRADLAVLEAKYASLCAEVVALRRGVA